MSNERRRVQRKTTEAVTVEDLTDCSNYNIIAKQGHILTASTKSFLVQIHRDQIVPKDLKQNLSLDGVVGQQIVLYLPQMSLDLDGQIIRAHHIGKGVFELVIAFSEDIPEYWRECLIELLPTPGEFD